MLAEELPEEEAIAGAVEVVGEVVVITLSLRKNKFPSSISSTVVEPSEKLWAIKLIWFKKKTTFLMWPDWERL